ncbi:MAG: MFS transporter [Gemmatimonadetes bacterium]|jgi:ATP:ADP antiporter, AAA family|nr:MFS transporter [Gemmatimonadota bacterium]
MPEQKSPLKQILNIRREEWPLALLMFGYFFLVITSFWILKPLKKSAFITFYKEAGFDLWGWQLTGSQAELIAKVLNMVVAIVAVTVFTLLVRSFRRQQLTYIFSAFFIVCYVLYTFVLDSAGDWTVWSFYLFGDLYSTLMVATFFAFLNDSVEPGAAKRLYGLIGLGGVAGGAFGSTIVRAQIKSLSYAEWLWICLGIGVAIGLIAMLVGRRVEGFEPAEPEPEPEEAKEAENPALEGARLVFRSRYLLAIVAIVGLYEMVSTIMDFQFTATIEHYLSGEEIGVQFSTVYALTNWVALFVQFFLTSFVMTRFGVGIALLFLPVAALAGSIGFMIFPALWIGSLLNTTDNGFSYSINQSAKEVLYVPTTRDEKYKAKAFIDMFVQRFAKALAVGLSLTITIVFAGFESVRWLSLLTGLILVLWIIAVRYVGRAFAEKEAAG